MKKLLALTVGVLCGTAAAWAPLPWAPAHLVFAAEPATPPKPGAPAATYSSDELAAGADDYVAELARRRPPSLYENQRAFAQKAVSAEQLGDNLARLKRWSAAADAYLLAIADSSDPAGGLWLKLAQAQAGASLDRAQVSAYRAYTRSNDPEERAAALRIIGREYDRHDAQKEALAAYNASLALASDANIAERATQLRRLVAFRLVKVDVAAESDQPEACLIFNEKLSPRRDVPFASFVRTTPANDGLVVAKDEQLCIEGLKHGVDYAVDVQPGLPSAAGETLTDAQHTHLTVPDRKSTIAFSGSGYVLPAAGATGLPVTTVNMDRLAIKLLKVNDRNLAPSIDAEKLTLSFSQSDVQQVVEHSGALVWQGEMTVKNQPNRSVSTAIPLARMIKDKSPGLYLAVVARPGLVDSDFYGESNYGLMATNWVLVSDLGLTTYTGLDGMTVAVRSLAAAKPLPEVTVRLFARNNGELASAVTDGDGLARFPAGALKGTGGDEPIALMAYAKSASLFAPVPLTPPPAGDQPSATSQSAASPNGVPAAAPPAPDAKPSGSGSGGVPGALAAGGVQPVAAALAGDFNFLDLGRPVFDFSDRGVEGIAAPGPVDAFAYTERGIYRPGETVNLVTLVRDTHANALPDLPVFLKILRPDGVQFQQRRLAPKSGTEAAAGGYHEQIALPRGARMGQWTVEIHVDPKGPVVGQTSFRVEDFVPPQLAVELSAPNQPVTLGQGLPVDVVGRYYYGAPAAQLQIEGDVTVAAAANPFPDWAGYQFGIDGEQVSPTRKDLEIDPTDSEGKAHVDVDVADLPSVSRPLDATIRIAVMEPSGRAVNAVLTRPVSRPLSLGLKSTKDGVDEGQPAGFEVIALGPKGERVAAPGISYSLVREDYGWRWYNDQGSWTFKQTERDRPVSSGKLPIAADEPASLEQTLPSGRYRLEVVDAVSSTTTSLKFGVGWWEAASDSTTDIPDKLTVSSDKASYLAGATAHLHIKPPFAGEGQIVIAADRVYSVRNAAIPLEGATIDLPVEAAWGGGVYAMVSVYKPGAPGAQRGPARAVGVAHLGLDSAARTLLVKVTAPETARPRTPVQASVEIGNLPADAGQAYVTLAAVDEAVLRLTDFAVPAPQAHFYGKHALGVGMRDLYGRLIDGAAGAAGEIRSGGDERSRRAVAGLPDPSVKVADLFSGIVRLDGSGKATIPLALPDFQGQLHVMAVAWTPRMVGSGDTKMTVRDPVVTMVSLPRFLATGDSGVLSLTMNNLSGPAGSYHVVLTTEGAVTLAHPFDRSLPLAVAGHASETVRLLGVSNGHGRVHLEVTGPNDLAIARDWDIGVRPPQAYETRRLIGRLAPGESLTLDDAAADQYVPGTGEVLATLSPRPDWDVPGLLRALDRYPYGCIEQTTSRALPLLYVEEVAKLWQADPKQVGQDVNGPGTANTHAVLNGAIERILEMQKDDGSFGLWSASDTASPWVDAYVVDFLTRAREHGIAVPDLAFDHAAAWLHDWVRQASTKPADLPALAYAYYDLARLKKVDVGDVRLFIDTKLSAEQTPLARIQLAAAAAQFGDSRRAAEAFSAALQPNKRSAELQMSDDGTVLRDLAGVVSFGAADFFDKKRLPPLVDDIAQRFSRATYLSTQEQAWLLMAAEAAAAGSNGQMVVSTDGGRAETRARPLNVRREFGRKAASQTLRNSGDGPIWRTVSFTGVPRNDLPAASSGFTLSRDYYHLDGSKADLANIRQSDLLVAVIRGKRTGSDDAPRQALVVDLLPAGLEIETATVSKGRTAADLAWVGDLAETTEVEARDDRFVAALDLAAGSKDQFQLAYIVRAVTQGEFRVPATVIEDMYRPDLNARTALGRLTVKQR